MTTELMPTAKSQPKPKLDSMARTKAIQCWQCCGFALVDRDRASVFMLRMDASKSKNCDCKQKSTSFSQWGPFPMYTCRFHHCFISFFSYHMQYPHPPTNITRRLLCKCALIVCCCRIKSVIFRMLFSSSFFRFRKGDTGAEIYLQLLLSHQLSHKSIYLWLFS